MIKKLTFIITFIFGLIACSQNLDYEVSGKEPKLTEKYLFATLKGKIDGKHDITMNIQIFDVNSLAVGMTVWLAGNYYYDKFGKYISFYGHIQKNAMVIIAAEGSELFTFKLDKKTLNKILELKTSSKKIKINGTLESDSKIFPCVINSVSPLKREKI